MPLFAANTHFFHTYCLKNEENELCLLLFFAHFALSMGENRMVYTKKSMLNRPKTNEKGTILINIGEILSLKSVFDQSILQQNKSTIHQPPAHRKPDGCLLLT